MMTHNERTIFLESRKRGVGGSDTASLLSNQIQVEYGCERNLWARLSNVPADNPDVETEPMSLGNVCEPYVRRAYSDKTGRRVEQFGLKKHDTVESLQYHDDGLIYPAPDDVRKSNGVLEIKAVGREMMRKINEDGLVIDYVLQAEAGAAAHDLDWSSFAVGMREDLLPLIAIEQAAIIAGQPMPKLPRRPKILHFDLDANPDTRKAIEEYAPKFWATIGDESKSPPRLDPDDHRCQRCVRKNWCQGKALMESVQPENNIPRRGDLAPLVEEYRTNIAILKEVEELVEATEKKWKEALGPVTAVKVQVEDDWKNVIWRIRKGAERVDGRAMAVVYDQIRRAAIAAGLAGADLTPPSSEFEKQGAPSRPLLLSSLLPKKPKKKGEVPEVDGPDEDFSDK
jgi:hypothetical protein